MRWRELFERKMANLYHSTTVDNAVKVLQQGKIEPNVSKYGDGSDAEENAISLTRDRNYIFIDDILFAISQEKLAHHHKIKPINYTQVAKDDFGFDPKGGTDKEEAEERVYKSIPVQYIQYIIANSDKFSEKDFIDQEPDYKHNREMLKTFGADAILPDKEAPIKRLFLLAKKLHIPFYFQKL